MGRVRTKTVKKASRVIIEKYYPKLTLDFHTNKRICEEIAIIPSKKMRNKIAGFVTHLMQRIQRGAVRGISIKLQEEERERRDNYMPDVSAVDPEHQSLEVDQETDNMIQALMYQQYPCPIITRCNELITSLNSVDINDHPADYLLNWLRNCIGNVLSDVSTVNLTQPLAMYKVTHLRHILGWNGLAMRTVFRLEELAAFVPCMNEYGQEIMITPFTMYMNAFALHLPAATVGQQLPYTDWQECLYLSLVEEYILMFFPSHNGIPNLPVNQQKTGMFNPRQKRELEKKPFQTTPFKLISKDFLKNVSCVSNGGASFLEQNHRNESMNAPSCGLTYSWKFVQILVEKWVHIKNAQTALPSSIQLAGIRFLIKHVHRYCYSPTPVTHTQSNELKELLIPTLIHAPLLQFFALLFHIWPLDASFRAVLETWFTYLQPWRYTQLQGNDRWLQYVSDNSAYLSGDLISSLLHRFTRMDLSSTKNLLILSRFTKVICTNPIAMYLPKNVLDSNLEQLFVECTLSLRQAEKDLLEIRELVEAERKENCGSWWAWVQFDRKSTQNEMQLANVQNAYEQLKGIVQALKQVTPHEDVCTVDGGSVVKRSFLNKTATIGVSGVPDSVRDATTGLLHLTPTGRYQVRNRLRHYDVGLDGGVPSDLKPIALWEIVFLVRILHLISAYINNAFGNQ